MNHLPFRLLSLAFLLVTPVASQGSLWIVDDQSGPGTDFTQLQPAIDAAQSGDTVLVRSVATGSFVIDGKGLTVISESFTYGGCTVRNVPMGETVLVRGFQSIYASLLVVHVEDSMGEVWIEDGNWRVLGDGVLVEDSRSVTFARCSMEGIGMGYDDQPFRVLNSDVRMFDSRVEVLGTAPTSPFPDEGSDALTLIGGSLWLDGCRLTGGEGADGFVFGFPPTQGGAGVHVSGGAQLTTRDCLLQGGAGGTGAGIAPKGSAVELAGGAHTKLTGSARPVALPSGALVGGTTATVTASAPAGELVLLLVGFDVDPRSVPGLPDALLPAKPMLLVDAGTVPADGLLTLQLPVPDLGPGLPALNVVVQGVFLTGAPAWVLGQASASALVSL